jgi:flagellar hook-associated protein 3 FlgL
MQRAEANQRALDASINAMQLTESALGDAGEQLQQARELVMQAGNGSLSASDRRILGESLRGLRADLLSTANRTDGAGRYLFAGQGSDSAPMVDTPDGVEFRGTSGSQRGDAGEALMLTVDGRAAWLQARVPTDPTDPNSPTTELSVFTALDQLSAALLDDTLGADEISAAVRQGLGDIDTVSDNLSAWRSRAGDALNRADGIGERIAQYKLDAQAARSSAEDLDMVQAISDFQNQQSGYDAALKTYSIVQKMSLFEYLR